MVRGMKQTLWFFSILLLIIAPGTAQQESADLILTNARVWTAETDTPWAEAIAIKSDRILFSGSAAETEKFRGEKTRRIDLSGKLVLPGFIDSHIHLMGGALSLDRIDLAEETTLEELQIRIRTFAAEQPDRKWIVGRGWFYSSFPGGLPIKEQLDAAVPDRPAYMECYDGHTGWANSLALKAAGITTETKDPADGQIVRDPKTGEPTGALKEAAMALVENAIPLPDENARYQLFLQSLRLLNSQGITSVQDADYTIEEMDRYLKLFDRAKKEGRLTVRTVVAVRMEEQNYKNVVARARQLAETYNGDDLRLGTVKGYVDGVIEARTAAMLQPYADSSETGHLNWDAEKLKDAVTMADRAGLQVYLHAIGDRGVRTALDAYEAAQRANGAADRRQRVEHIETIAPEDYERFHDLDIIASMQPLHADPNQNIFDVWAKNAGPERSQRAFSWRNFEKANVRLVFGSDWPVVTSDVLRGLFCAVTRKTRSGTPPGGWQPHLAVSLESALRHYTLDAAYASFDEKLKGSIKSGKYADLVVLSNNILETSPEAILQTRVLFTIQNGKIVYSVDPKDASASRLN